jgi:pSer/pThr/pTyr-binding forkhead associated (FHA) protein
MPEKKFILKKVPRGPEIALTASLTVGRSKENDLKLVEGSPSRKHALLSVRGGAVFVEDLNSTNGTYVNDQRITSTIKLKPDDRVRFDAEEYLLLEEPSREDKTAVRPGTRAVPVEIVAQSSRLKVPAGWVDNRQLAEGKTQYMSAEELGKLRQSALGAEASPSGFGVVDTPGIIILEGSGAFSRVKLRAEISGMKEWTVGSEGEREILIKRAGVSALHAKIVNEGNRWKVVDQVSANGTFVNGNRCITSFLSSGDRISFGSVECIFQLPGAKASKNAAAGAANLKKVLIIAGISFVVTMAVLYYLLNKF